MTLSGSPFTPALSSMGAVVLSLLLAWPGATKVQGNETATGVQIWDTRAPVNKDLQVRSEWKPIPSDLLTLERDPSAASSDPSYYGRGYTFQGDVVVENQHVTAVFQSGKGSVVIYSGADPRREAFAFVPRGSNEAALSMAECSILQNTGDDVALEVFFAAPEASERLSVVFSFDRTEIVAIKPAESAQGVSLLSSLTYGIVPSFVGDDLIFDPRQYPLVNKLHIPWEHFFLGLLPGQDRMLVLTCDQGRQAMRLMLDGDAQGERQVKSIEVDTEGESIYLALLHAPGIWHREALQPTYLEKDVRVNWQKPFPAKWITQLDEAKVKTTFTFRESKGKIWRGVIGSYSYPVWFSQGDAFYRLSKKIPPQGESLVYFLERRHTPASVTAPVDIVKATLGRSVCDTILDLPGRRLRSHHRRDELGIRRACTCGCTAAIEAVFKAGEETDKREYIEGAVDDMVYFVEQHMQRIQEYQDFAADMLAFLRQSKQSTPGLKSYLGHLEVITQQIPQEYQRQLENIKTLDYTYALASKTKALAQTKETGNQAECLELGARWRQMGGAQDYLLGLFHSLTRRLFQEAGYGCVKHPRAVAIAYEIREYCRSCLRNPDGYEIWSDY